MITLPMLIVLALILGLLVLFFREIYPIPLTALLAAIVLMVSGVLTPEEGLSGFSSRATITVMAMFVLSAGMKQTGAVEALTRRLIAWAGDSHRRQILALSLAAGPISGFVNNTPVVAVLIPAALQMARKSRSSPSKLLMPVSHMAMLGGLATVIGTSTNLLANAILARMGYRPFGFFEFSLVGAIALAVGLAYYLTLGLRLLPDRGAGDLVERFDLHGFLAEFAVPAGSQLIGQTLEAAGFDPTQGWQILGLSRGGQTLGVPPSSLHLREGDELLMEGSRERLGRLAREKGLVALPQIKHPLSMEDGQGNNDMATAEVVITMGSRYVGQTLAQIDFRAHFEAMVLAVRHQGRMEIGPLSQGRLHPGDVLLVQGTPHALEQMREMPDLFVTRLRGLETYRRDKLPHAIGIILGVVLASSLGWLDIAVAALGGATLMVMTGCLRMDEFLSAIHWEIILMLGGLIPLGIALEKTGGAALMARGLVDAGHLLPGVWFLVALFLVTSLITEVASNNASVVLLVPVAITAAVGLGLDPRPVALTVSLAASTSMMTPMGYQTNTMILEPGNYRFRDYARVGAPLNLLLAGVIPLAVAWLFPL